MNNPDPFDPIGDLIAVDPSIRSPGVALFRAGVLVAADRVKIDEDVHELEIGMRCARVAADIVRWSMEVRASPRFLVVEWPVIYPGRRAKAGRQVKPKDILTLAGVAGAVAGIFGAALAHRGVGLLVKSPTPAEWVGQLPKATDGDPLESPRGGLIASVLSPAELALVPKKHDAVDAVGLGLWGLNRLTAPKRHARPGTPGLRLV